MSWDIDTAANVAGKIQQGVHEGPDHGGFNTSAVLSPDTMLPAQFFHLWKGHSEMAFAGERRMLVELLLDACQCFVNRTDDDEVPLPTPPKRVGRRGPSPFKRKSKGREAMDWIMDRCEPLGWSYAWVCEQLDIDAGALRRALLAYPRGMKIGMVGHIVDKTRP